MINNSIDANDTSHAVGEYYNKAETNCKRCACFCYNLIFKLILLSQK